MRLKFFFSMLAAAAIALTGCNKQTELEINYGKTATVQGKVTLVQSGQEDKAAADIKVYAQIAYADLVTTNDRENPEGNKIFETKTDGEGKYSFELPVVDGGTLVTFYTETKIEENGYFVYSSTPIRLFPNKTEFLNIGMNFTSTNTTKNIKVMGTVTESDYPNDPISDITVVAKYAGQFYKAVTDANGKYSISLPFLRNERAQIFTNPKSDGSFYYPCSYYGYGYITIEEYPEEIGNINITVYKQPIY